ncbi:hypothetical protein [Pseudomonas sp. A-RE-19]|uniref:hypothetical protein n=1 Tax=Pseudomonas sp. A-RE-19 TaxID=2832401 RepID=UPI001CBBE95C|nr:hypothetical protein [Pseudomonas sp. A-RE-19]
MLTPAELDHQRITHAKLTMILSREPWALPDPNRKARAPRAAELLKTMSQRAAAEELGISRRQLAKMIEAEAQTVEDDNPFIVEEFVPLPRRVAIDLIAEKACRPQGAKWADYRRIVLDLYGLTDDGRQAATEQQRKDLRKAVKKKHPTALFVADWVDTDRAASQRDAVLAEVIELSDRVTEATTRLAQAFPGGSAKAIQVQLLNLIDYRTPSSTANWGGPEAERAVQLTSRVGNAGPVISEPAGTALPDRLFDSLCF